MLESFFKIVLVGASADVIELINNLVVEAYERKGITETTDCTNFKAEDFPLFSDLLAVLQEKNKEEMDNLTLRDMRTAELYLQKFVTADIRTSGTPRPRSKSMQTLSTSTFSRFCE